jgi:hypothetical protein
MHIDISTTIQHAQHEVVCSLLPRRHDVMIAGRYNGFGLLGMLRADADLIIRAGGLFSERRELPRD